MHVIKMLIKITLSYRMAVDLWQDFGCLQDKAAIIAPTFSQYCHQVKSTPMAQRPNSKLKAAGFEPRTFITCMPQAVTLTN